MGRTISYEGEKVETYLAWAKAELIEAEKAGSDRKRHTTQAAGHAKRALDRLFDLYLKRDWLGLRLGPRPGFSEKLELMKLRSGEYLPWRSIDQLVSRPRNISEHEFVSPTVQEAGLAVENATMIAEGMQARSNPLTGPAVFGFAGWSFSGDQSAWSCEFNGFQGKPFALICQDRDQVPLIGVGCPVNSHAAEIIYCKLVDINQDPHIEILKSWAKVPPDCCRAPCVMAIAAGRWMAISGVQG
ncbi:MAG: hypothetical protein JNJ46_07290 [Myxococcales bacterium]|nr:hypothetical protein [Myxococcales bacterium]